MYSLVCLTTTFWLPWKQYMHCCIYQNIADEIANFITSVFVKTWGSFFLYPCWQKIWGNFSLFFRESVCGGEWQKDKSFCILCFINWKRIWSWLKSTCHLHPRFVSDKLTLHCVLPESYLKLYYKARSFWRGFSSMSSVPTTLD